MKNKLYVISLMLLFCYGHNPSLAQPAKVNVQSLQCILKSGDVFASEKDLLGDWVADGSESQTLQSVLKIRFGTIVVHEKNLAIGLNWHLKDNGVFEEFEADKPTSVRLSCASMRGNKLVFTSSKGVERVLIRVK